MTSRPPSHAHGSALFDRQLDAVVGGEHVVAEHHAEGALDDDGVARGGGGGGSGELALQQLPRRERQREAGGAGAVDEEVGGHLDVGAAVAGEP